MSRTDWGEILKSRRAAAGAGTALLLVIMAAVGLPIGAAFHQQAERRSESLQELSELRAEAAAAPAIRGKLLELRERMVSLRGSLLAKDAALAQSQLQEAVEAITRANGATVRSAQIMAPSKENGFQAIGIQYDLAVPMSKLLDLTYAFESHVPYLFLAEASVSAEPAPPSSAPRDPRLDVRWIVKAYRWDGVR